MTAIIFIAVLAVLILAHECGHFIAAKKKGLLVEEFGIGFPPRIFGVKKGETLYSLNLLPLGGFVKILGEDGGETENPRSFASKSAGTRGLITVSGVVMNFLLAIVLLIIGFFVGLPQAIDQSNAAYANNTEIQILDIAAGSPAAKAGIQVGDAIEYLKIGGKNISIKEVSALQNAVSADNGKELIIGVKRGNSFFETKTTPRINPPEGEGALGIAIVKTGIIRYPWYKNFWLGTKSAFAIAREVIIGFFDLLKNLFATGRIPSGIAGPVGIAALTGKAASLGFIYLLQLVAVISINLAVLNLVPFPALDGGRLFFLGVEKIKGSKVNPKIENTVNSAGMILLLILIALITYRDILRLK